MASVYEILFSMGALFAIFLFLFLCLMAVWLIFEIVRKGFVWDAAVSHIIQHTDMTMVLFLLALGISYFIADRAGFFQVLFGVSR